MNYVNGKFVVMPFSEGTLYGTGVFETILVEDGRGELISEHFARLVEGCRTLEINFDMSETVFMKHINKFMERNTRRRYALRVSVAKKGYTYDFMINERVVPYGGESYTSGFKMTVGSLLKNPTSPLTYIKSVCYTDNLLSLRKARSSGYDEVLHLNFQGEVCEGAISNIFFVRNGVVRTPEVACGLLPGIMRDRVIDKLEEAGIEVCQGRYSLEDLMEADEVFLTNSLMKVMPVSEIDGVRKSSREISGILKHKL